MKLTKSEKIKESAYKATIHFFGGAPSTICLFLFGSAYLERFCIDDGIKNFKEKFYITFKLALAYWPFVYFLGYQFMARHFQNTFNDVFALFYAIALSHINNMPLSTAN